jgi:hypothetical protein
MQDDQPGHLATPTQTKGTLMTLLEETTRIHGHQAAVEAYLSGTTEETTIIFTSEETGATDARAALILTPAGEPWPQIVRLHAPCPCGEEGCLGIVLPFEFSSIGAGGSATLSVFEEESDSRHPAPVAWSTFLHDDGKGAWRATLSRESLANLIQETEFDGPGFPSGGASLITYQIPAAQEWEEENPTD